MDTIKLDNPIHIDGKEIKSITLRRPKVRDRLIVERMGDNDAEKEVALIANLSGLSKDNIEELDLSDYAKVQEVLQNFLQPLIQKT